MYKSLTILILMFLAIAQVSSLMKPETPNLLESIDVSSNLTTGFDLFWSSYERDKEATKMYEKNRTDPHWIYRYATTPAFKEKIEDQKILFSQAATLFEKMDKEDNLSATNLVEWAICLENTQSRKFAYSLVQDRLKKLRKGKALAFAYLATFQIKNALADMTKKGINDISDAESPEIALDFETKGLDCQADFAYLKEAKKLIGEAVLCSDLSIEELDKIGYAEYMSSLVEMNLLVMAGGTDLSDSDRSKIMESGFAKMMGVDEKGAPIWSLYMREYAKTNPNCEAFLIMAKLKYSTKIPDEYIRPKAEWSSETIVAVETARLAYLEMTKKPETRAYGYDGMAMLLDWTDGPLKEQLEYADKALELDPSMKNSLLIKYRECIKTDQEQAMSLAKASVKKRYTDLGYRLLMISCSKKGDYQAVERIYREAMTFQDAADIKDRPKLDLVYAAVLINQEKHRQAIDILSKITSNRSNDITLRRMAFYNIAVAMYLNGERLAISGVLRKLDNITKGDDTTDSLARKAKELKTKVDLDLRLF